VEEAIVTPCLAVPFQVNNCNVDGAVRLRADSSSEARVSQVAGVLDGYVLRANATAPCPAGATCIFPGEAITVGIGVSETQVLWLVVSACEHPYCAILD
jgi:uncharacterized membrane protein